VRLSADINEENNNLKDFCFENIHLVKYSLDPETDII